MGCPAVLIKGGHGHGAESVDYLIRDNGIVAISAPRIVTRNTHGTGCSLSSAIAAGLRQKARKWKPPCATPRRGSVPQIDAADRLGVGLGHGPIHHFHRFY